MGTKNGSERHPTLRGQIIFRKKIRKIKKTENINPLNHPGILKIIWIRKEVGPETWLFL